MSWMKPLIDRILKDQFLDWNGLHGLSHWGRVYENGMRLCDESAANRHVVELFAFFHDSRRFNDGTDLDHGKRGGEYAKKLRGELFELNDDEFELLYVACRDHTKGMTEADITIQTCWDSDRLDLGRVGITPAVNRLCTAAAKTKSIRNRANDRVCERVGSLFRISQSRICGDAQPKKTPDPFHRTTLFTEIVDDTRTCSDFG